MEITVKKLEALLGGSLILDGVDLEVPSNRMVGIIGPNGSGKSTLLRCIYRVLKPTKGAVFLDGRFKSILSASQPKKSLSWPNTTTIILISW